MTTIPVLIIFASLLGMVFHAGSVQIQQLPKILDTVFPPQPFAADIKEAVVRVVRDVVAYRTPLGIMGLLGLMVSALFVFGIVRTALHRIYRLRSTRFFLVSYLHDLFFVIVALVLLVVLNVVLWVLDFVRGYLVQRYTLDSTLLIQLDRGLPTAIVVFLTALLFYILYAYLTDTRPPWPAAAASTLTSTTLWLVSGGRVGDLRAVVLADRNDLRALRVPACPAPVDLLFVRGVRVRRRGRPGLRERLREHTVIRPSTPGSLPRSLRAK